MMRRDNAALVVVDVQGKLARLMSDKDALFANLQTVVSGFKLLDIPILWMEQLPDKLGPTIDEIAAVLDDQSPIPKSTFSCCGNTQFQERLAETNCRDIVLVGIEAHICVYQTAMDLIANGYRVTVVADAVSSRTAFNKEISLQRMSQAGALLSTVEMVLFELQVVAEGDRFKQLAKLIK